MIATTMSMVEYSAAILTFVSSFKAYKLHGSIENMEKGFIHVMLEQGVVYFCVVSLLTTAGTIVNLCAPSYFLQRMLCTFILPLSCLLNARFILHLRAWDHKRSSNATISGDEHSDPIQFAPALNRVNSVVSRFSVLEDFGDDPVRIASECGIEPFCQEEGSSRRKSVDLERGPSRKESVDLEEGPSRRF